MQTCTKCDGTCLKCTKIQYTDKRDKQVIRALYVDLAENGSVNTAFQTDETVRLIEMLLQHEALERINTHQILYTDGRKKDIYSVRKKKHSIWDRFWFDTVQMIGNATTN